MIFVNKIEVYNLKKRACGGLHSQRCSTCNVTHPQHHQSHHTSGAQEDSACTRTHRRRASTQLRLLKNSGCKTFPVCGIRNRLVTTVFYFYIYMEFWLLRCKLRVWDPLIGAHARKKRWDNKGPWVVHTQCHAYHSVDFGDWRQKRMCMKSMISISLWDTIHWIQFLDNTTCSTGTSNSVCTITSGKKDSIAGSQ